MSPAGWRILFFAFILPLVRATLFVNSPLHSTTCHGGRDCLVQWVNDGVAPSLSTIGPCYVGLYNGDGVLVQQIEPVDVSATPSLQFKPDPSAGPNSRNYYINFTSINLIGNPPAHYNQYSVNFALEGMSGSLQSPVPSDTSLPAVPSTVVSAPPNPISTTISVGNSFTSPDVTSSTSAVSAPSTSTLATASLSSADSSISTVSSTTAPSSQSTDVSASSTSNLESISSSSSSSSSSGASASTASAGAGSSTLTVTASFATSMRSSSASSPPSASSTSNSPASQSSATSGASRSILTGDASCILVLLLGSGVAIVNSIF